MTMPCMHGALRRRDLLRAFALVLSLSLFLSLAFVAPAAADDAIIKIDNFTFSPAVLTVKPGTTVTFENHDDIPHTVVDVAGHFRSKALDTGDRFNFTFGTAGEVNYFCGLHPHMKGRIVVAP